VLTGEKQQAVVRGLSYVERIAVGNSGWGAKLYWKRSSGQWMSVACVKELADASCL
jgi:hypothetical protein